MTGMQPDLDFTEQQALPAGVRKAINEGMRRAEEHAAPAWKRAIHSCIVARARKQRELTVDDVLEEMDSIRLEYLQRTLSKSDGVLEELEQLAIERCIRIPDNIPPSTHNLSALGPAMKRAESDGVLTHTDRTKRSTRKLKNGNRHNIWISNYYGAQ